jgi:hypothetical protein
MTKNEIEHMWKVASNNPNHDTNWHDPVVLCFASLVAKHTLSNIDPSNFMSYQEGVEAGRFAEREACAVIAETPISGEQDDITMQAKDRVAAAIRARGQA